MRSDDEIRQAVAEIKGRSAARRRYNVSFAVDLTEDEVKTLPVKLAEAVDCQHVGAFWVSPAQTFSWEDDIDIEAGDDAIGRIAGI